MSTAWMMEGGRKVGRRKGKNEGREGEILSLLCWNKNPTVSLSCPKIKSDRFPNIFWPLETHTSCKEGSTVCYSCKLFLHSLVSDLSNEDNFRSTRRGRLTWQGTTYIILTWWENPPILLIQETFGWAAGNQDSILGFKSLELRTLFFIWMRSHFVVKRKTKQMKAEKNISQLKFMSKNTLL